MLTVVGGLRGEPFVQRRDELWIAGGVPDGGSLGLTVIADVDPVVALFESVQSGHVGAVDLGGVAELAAGEGLSLFSQVFLDESDLGLVGRIVRDDALDASVGRRVESWSAGMRPSNFCWANSNGTPSRAPSAWPRSSSKPVICWLPSEANISKGGKGTSVATRTTPSSRRPPGNSEATAGSGGP